MMEPRNSRIIHLTVAICTHNRAGLLGQTLESLTNVRVPSDVDWRVLIVNNNCTDSTDTVVARYGERLPLGTVSEPRLGINHARNRAVVESTGDFVVFIDDDVLLDSEWLAGFVDAVRDGQHATVWGGPIEPWYAHTPPSSYLLAFPSLRRGFCGL